MTEKSETLNKLQTMIDEKRAEFAATAISARKQGYAAMPKRSVELKVVEDWINSIRDEDDPRKI